LALAWFSPIGGQGGSALALADLPRITVVEPQP
jgi:hypothetical protein